MREDYKYAIGRNPYPEGTEAHENIEVLEKEDLQEQFDEHGKLEGTAKKLMQAAGERFRSDQEKTLRELEDFQHLAWTPRVRHLYYNPEQGVLVKDVEGDIFVWFFPSKDTIEEQVQDWPKAEVSLGERYDSRFPNSKPKA